MLKAGIASTTTFEGIKVQPIPLSDLAPWVVFSVVLALLTIYFVGAEQGAISIVPGMGIHEFVHDGRHLLGFPCH